MNGQVGDSDLTVLITVYAGTVAAELSEALDSLWVQTRPADEVLVVKDGPVPEDVKNVLIMSQDAHQEMRVVELPENVGSGPASQRGVEESNGRFIARLDADDIAMPTRFEKQLNVFEQAEASNRPLAVVGSSVIEFDDAKHKSGLSLEESKVSVRRVPDTHGKILRYGRLRNPVNHPSVMMKRNWILEVGGYQDVHFMEDYDLCVRILVSGGKFYNIRQPLTWMRTSLDQRKRRTGKEMFAVEWAFQQRLVEYGLTTWPRAIFNFCVRNIYRMLPTNTLQTLNKFLFR